MNDKVKADGISINASAEGVNFEIAVADDDGYIPGSSQSSIAWPQGQTVASSKITGSLTLIPTHPVKLAVGYDYTDILKQAKWYHAFSEKHDESQGDAVQTEISNLAYDLNSGSLYEVGGNQYALVTNFYLRLNPEKTESTISMEDIVATNIVVTDSTGTNDLSKCVYLFVAGEDGAYEVAPASSSSGETNIVAPSESGVLIKKITPTVDEVHVITVYAFFEGMDDDCKNSNYKATDLSISLDFVGTTKSN